MENNSLISEKISKFYQNIGESSELKGYYKPWYLLNNGCLDFKELYAIYQGYLQKNAVGYNYDVSLCCSVKLLPIFESIHHYYVNSSNDLEDLGLAWVGENYKYVYRLQLNQRGRNNKCLTVESCLLLTSILENALANVFYTVNVGKSTPPHLLRDLLRTEELDSVFGMEIISFLQFLLGTPHSVNLRNIVWHGFPKPHEIPDYYTTILINVIHSLGCKLQEKQMLPLIERPKITDFGESCKKIAKGLSLEFDEDKCVQLLKDNNWLHEDFKIYWHQMLHYYKNQENWKVVLLITPHIELLLRLIYARLNNFDVRAKLNEYYITMDTVFESEVPQGKHDKDINNKPVNKMLFVNEDLLKCIYDLFIAPNGLRLRDKVSHGEVDLNAIDNKLLCDILLTLSMGLLTYETPFSNYESVFHLNCLAKEALHLAAEQLQQFMEKYSVTKCTDNLKAMGGELKPFNSAINIFHRHKRQSEFVLLLLKNSNLIQKCCYNYAHSIDTKMELLTQRELHSKRRRTLERLLVTLPLVCNVLFEILMCLMCIFKKLQDGNTIYECDEKLAKLARFLKHTLKLNENFVKYSDINSNEWIKAMQLCEKFHNIKLMYY